MRVCQTAQSGRSMPGKGLTSLHMAWTTAGLCYGCVQLHIPRLPAPSLVSVSSLRPESPTLQDTIKTSHEELLKLRGPMWCTGRRTGASSSLTFQLGGETQSTLQMNMTQARIDQHLGADLLPRTVFHSRGEPGSLLEVQNTPVYLATGTSAGSKRLQMKRLQQLRHTEMRLLLTVPCKGWSLACNPAGTCQEHRLP